MSLPTDYKARKAIPIGTGVLDYFPDALAEVAKVSLEGNNQHNAGQPLHWQRGKSTDHYDTLTRHGMERGTIDTDGQRHSAKMAWRALALLQEELEAARGDGTISRGSWPPEEIKLTSVEEIPLADPAPPFGVVTGPDGPLKDAFNNWAKSICDSPPKRKMPKLTNAPPPPNPVG